MSNNTVWNGDLLNRKGEGDYLITYLVNRYNNNPDSPFVLNINAEWGFGKTYFLKNLTKDLENKKHPVVYFDAWKNDFTDNPLLAFMSELNTSLDVYLNNASKAKSFFQDAYNTSKGILLPILTKKLTGHAISELNDLFEQEDIDETQQDENTVDFEIQNGVSSVISKIAEVALSEHKTIQQSIETFKRQMKKLLSHIDKNMDAKKLPMFILIDELDRCRPNYAIELLENIKHIFDISGVVFIVATDSQQLAHSINAIYGNNFSSERYLKRFFHQEYNLAKPDNYSYANYLLDKHNLLSNTQMFSPLDRSLYADKNIVVELFAGYTTFFKLGLRDQEQAVTMLEAIVLVLPNNETIHLGYLLFLIMLKQKNSEAFVRLNETPMKLRKSFVTQNFFDKINVDMTVSFEDYRRDRDTGLQGAQYSVSSLISIYLELLNINYGEFHNKYDQGTVTSNNIETNIFNIIRTRIQQLGHPDVKTMITTYLDKYPELVLRTGRFS